MALPIGPELGVKYILNGPDGTVACFNDTTDANNIGTLTDATGFDSPDVRESADDLAQMDGGVHGDFFYGRRPVTLSGLIHGHVTAAARNTKIARLQQASNALRSDAILTWTPSGGAQVFLRVRRQQPLRLSGGWNKDFQLALVSADPRIYSYALNTLTVNSTVVTGVTGRAYPAGFDVDYGPASPSGALLPTNAGTGDTFPLLTITGPGTNPTISNLTTGGRIRLNYTLAAGETLVVDTLNHTVKLGGTADRYGAVDFVNTSWFGLAPGTNDVRIAWDSFGTGASLRVDWRDAWL